MCRVGPCRQSWSSSAEARMGYGVWGSSGFCQSHTQSKYAANLISLLVQPDDLTRILVCEESHG